jgi:hypothetical protein
MDLRGKPLIVHPGKGIGPFLLGMTRDEIQGLTREPIHSFYPQTWSTVRSDAHDILGVTVAYDDDARANHITGYVRIRHGTCTLELEGERLCEATRATMTILLELLETTFTDTGEAFEAPALGLTIGFLEPDEGECSNADPCDWIVVRPLPAGGGDGVQTGARGRGLEP